MQVLAAGVAAAAGEGFSPLLFVAVADTSVSGDMEVIAQLDLTLSPTFGSSPDFAYSLEWMTKHHGVLPSGALYWVVPYGEAAYVAQWTQAGGFSESVLPLPGAANFEYTVAQGAVYYQNSGYEVLRVGLPGGTPASPETVPYAFGSGKLSTLFGQAAVLRTTGITVLDAGGVAGSVAGVYGPNTYPYANQQQSGWGYALLYRGDGFSTPQMIGVDGTVFAAPTQWGDAMYSNLPPVWSTTDEVTGVQYPSEVTPGGTELRLYATPSSIDNFPETPFATVQLPEWLSAPEFGPYPMVYPATVFSGLPGIFGIGAAGAWFLPSAGGEFVQLSLGGGAAVTSAFFSAIPAAIPFWMSHRGTYEVE